MFRFAESQILGPSLFFSVDRSPRDGDNHVVEALRGMKAGIPDTWLILPTRIVACELKTRGRPESAQEACGRLLLSLGHHWFWTRTVMGYGEELDRIGVGLCRHWRIVAEDADLRLRAKMDRVAAERKAAKRQAALPLLPAAR